MALQASTEPAKMNGIPFIGTFDDYNPPGTASPGHAASSRNQRVEKNLAEDFDDLPTYSIVGDGGGGGDDDGHVAGRPDLRDDEENDQPGCFWAGPTFDPATWLLCGSACVDQKTPTSAPTDHHLESNPKAPL